VTSENGLPTCVRFKDLQARGIVGSWAALQDLIKNQAFPPGRLRGPSSRIWTTDEISQWLDSRPTGQSEQTRQRAQRSIAARLAHGGSPMTDPTWLDARREGKS
jgi:hypothetical protein